MAGNQRQTGTRPALLRVLIADDMREARRNARLLLSLIPDVEVVAIAQDGREAVELMKVHQPDVAVIDVNMPEMTGLDAIKSMLRARPEMVCIVMSAEKDSQTLREAMAVGARDYLIKPFTADELEDAIGRARKTIMTQRLQYDEASAVRRQRDKYLTKLANEYAQARRTDDEALEVFEELAENPNCDLHLLMTLAMIYVVRKRWRKLQALAARLEKEERAQAT